MSRDPAVTYHRAVALASDGGNAPGRLLRDLKDGFALGNDVFGVRAQEALWRRIGLVKCEILIDGPNFDITDLYQRQAGHLAWVMPVVQTPAFGGAADAEVVDLIAFADSGPHKDRVWRLLGALHQMGLEYFAGRRIVRVCTNPKVWLEQWLEAFRATPDHLSHEECGPETVSALILDRKMVDWRAYRLEQISVFAEAQEILFVDDAELRDQVAKEMKLDLPPLPRLRARKG